MSLACRLVIEIVCGVILTARFQIQDPRGPGLPTGIVRFSVRGSVDLASKVSVPIISDELLLQRRPAWFQV